MSTASSTPHTIALDQLDQQDLAAAGGKGANLGSMLKAGLPVPAGFCITAETYRTVVREIESTIRADVVDLDIEDSAALEATARMIRSKIEARPLLPEIVDAIGTMYMSLATSVNDDAPPVAVRSSATAEDLPDASFAGQQETLLNVRGLDSLLDAVRRCWSSLWTPRAIAYRARNGFDHEAVALAVVVQFMIDAQVSGVLFTADPVSGHRARIVVNGSWGLGEAIVSGLVSPDGWVLDHNGTILEHELGPKERMIVYAPGGGVVEQPTPRELRERPCLTTNELQRLAVLGRAAQAHFGAPQDIEWALRDGQLYLVQSRPITTLFPLPSPRPRDDDFHVYLSFNAIQGIIEPLTPMGMDMFREGGRLLNAGGIPLFHRPDGASRFVEAASRLYFDATVALRHPLGRRAIQIPFKAIDPTTTYAFPKLLDDPRLAPSPLDRLRTVRAVAKTLWKVRLLPMRVLSAFLRPVEGLKQAEQVVTLRVSRLEKLVSRPRTLMERRVMIRAFLLAGFPAIIASFPPRVAPGMIASVLVERLAARWRLPLEKVVALRQGLPGNPTTEMDLELWRLSQLIKHDPDARACFRDASDAELARAYHEGQLPVSAQTGLCGFLWRYGHRGVREIDVGMPRWSEDPSYILNTIRNYFLLDDPALAPDARFAALAHAAESARESLVQAARAQRGGFAKAWLLDLLTRRMRVLMGAREAHKFWAVRVLALNRRMLQGAGADLVREGLIERADDVFFLRLDELKQADENLVPSLAERVAARRSEYTRELSRQQLPRILTSDGEIIAGKPPQTDPNQLLGVGVSPGISEARVRVIRDPHGARLEPGEILVAPSTDPAWTPLFLTASGLVMEAGGTLSHGSVVAREYGIPAVVGVPEATSRLRTGDTARIDGTLGTVALVVAPLASHMLLDDPNYPLC